MGFSSFIFILGIVFLGLVTLSVPFWLLHRLHKWLARKGYPRIGIVIIASFAVYLGYSSYTAVYPTDDFYLDEFKQVTLREAPKSAVVLRKDASYPDFHGDYCSAALIILSESDFDKLLTDLNADFRLDKAGLGPVGGSFELNEVLGNRKDEKLLQSFVRNNPGKEDQHLQIGFFNDNKTIIISICVT